MIKMLQLSLYPELIEAGCDEAGRGCLAGAVFAAAVILPKNFVCDELDDSKQLTEKQRYRLRNYIEDHSISWSVGIVHPIEIDEMNILNASFLAMRRAVEGLWIAPQHLLIDGNRFNKFDDTPHTCIVKGDGKLMPIAAASVLAKTYRDDYMRSLDAEYPLYGWRDNKGYPTRKHRKAIQQHGITPFHRLSFKLTEKQLSIGF